MRVHVLSVARGELSPEEYEDASWPGATCEVGWGDAPVRLAVADGATTSSFAREWARLLAEGWGTGCLQAEGDGILALSQRWRDSVDLDGLAWFAAEKARGGSHAALIGLELCTDGSWSATAVGDCCLFVVRNDTLIVSFPAESPTELDGRPTLVGSALTPAEFCRIAKTRHSHWEAGDTLLLMSDALARWFLDAALERRSSPWRVLVASSGSQKTFAGLIARLRENGSLQADDVTLVSVTL